MTNREVITSFPKRYSTFERNQFMSRAIAGAVFVLMALLPVGTFVLNAQTQLTPSSTLDPKNQDAAAIEAIVHGNPSEHVAEDVSFTNIFGTVRFGRAEFQQRHVEIERSIFKGTSVKTSIGKLRFVRSDVAIVDVSGEMTGFAKVPPGLPVGTDGTLRFRLLEVLVKEKGEWWITEYHNVAVTPELK
jgi:uncharacterized protein (TIGR02246 family)